MQLNEDQERFLKKSLVTMQIIAGALIQGVVIFLVVVVFFLPVPPNRLAVLNSYIGLGLALVAMAMSLVVPNIIVASTKKSLVKGRPIDLPKQFGEVSDLGFLAPLAGLYQTKMIIAMALLEGAAFFNLVSYMMERQPFTLAVVGMLLLALVMNFPTRRGLEKWLAEETKSIAEMWSLEKPDQ
jgi:hypothetical protein